ncbi:MAG: DUF697 domain-containing protein [bacterium]
MAKLPLNLSKALDAWKEASAKADRSASVVLAGDERLVELAQHQFSVGGTVPATWVGPLEELPGVSSVAGEVLVVLVAAEREAEVLAVLGSARPKGGAVVAVDEGSGATGKITYPGKGLTRVSFSDSPAGWRQVFSSCAGAAGDHTVALGRRYPAVRAAAARRVIDRTAGQNALIGLLFVLPGADMPAMTLNQIKMILSIASIYGEQIDLERAVELAGVVGMGFGFRALSRLLVRSTPGLGWVLKAVTGYTATLAVGLGAVHYFEKGAPASTSRVVALAKTLKS